MCWFYGNGKRKEKDKIIQIFSLLFPSMMNQKIWTTLNHLSSIYELIHSVPFKKAKNFLKMPKHRKNIANPVKRKDKLGFCCFRDMLCQLSKLEYKNATRMQRRWMINETCSVFAYTILLLFSQCTTINIPSVIEQPSDKLRNRLQIHLIWSVCII